MGRAGPTPGARHELDDAPRHVTAEAEYERAVAVLDALRARVAEGKTDGGALALAEYRVARASMRLTSAVVDSGHDDGDAA